ncbi:hypothetical protein B4U79_18401 [Dinothrombium tinctorium]|uniref:SKP1 component POZ domain-containing protein n=1 Tax=Dinothrombium tinctorium TaxID=1965070 RepID=A0A3S3NQ24_9ACAR|nr:hypothetical protein B4U79_18468 [Dinothrombium tinctorium]RWS03714.1 hypothetical protein B4U79_18407 [Dinothrombium tinctorium]RWS03873.1 hypothetical protein B4U79_18401 [Dinothrombium tinctorium]
MVQDYVKGNMIIQIDDLTDEIFEKMVQWMRHHKDDTDIDTESDESEESEGSNDSEENNGSDENNGSEESDANQMQNISYEIDPWDAEFLDVDLSTLFHLLNAADFWEIKGKSSDEILSMLREKCCFTEGKLQRISNKYEWLARND